MERSRHWLMVFGALAAIVLMVAAMFWFGAGRRQARRGAPGATLAAAVTRGTSAAWLGLTLQPVTSQLRKRLGLPRSGVVVSDVAPGSPAAQAGLARGDLLRQVAGTAVTRPAQVEDALREVQAGERVRVTRWRQGQTAELEIVAAAPVARPVERPAVLPEATVEIEVAWLGLDLVELSPAEAAEANGADVKAGMLVDDVAAGRGKDAGLVPGDVIVAVNGRPTRSIPEFKEATKEAVGALLDVIRGPRHLYVSIAPPGTTAAERRLMQQRLPLATVNWDGGWLAPRWPTAAPAWPTAAPAWPTPTGQPAAWGWWLSPGWQAQATFGWHREPNFAWQPQALAAPAAPAPAAPAPVMRPAARPAGWDWPTLPVLPFVREDPWPGGWEDLRARPGLEAQRPELDWRGAAPGIGAFAAGGR